MQPRLPAPDTLPDILLTLIALSGEFPSAQIVRLSGGDAYKENVVKQLKREKLIRTFYRDGLRGLRLTAAAKRLLLERQPEQFRSYLTGCSDTNRLKSEAPRRRRLRLDGPGLSAPAVSSNRKSPAASACTEWLRCW